MGATDASARSRTIARKQLSLRAELWPKLDTTKLWHDQKKKGWTRIPRTFPLVMRCMDELSKNFPVSGVYLDFWCRMFDESFLSLAKADELAYHGGFTGQRAVTTWRDRVRRLKGLGFIDTALGAAGDLSYAVVFSPYPVLHDHSMKKTPGLSERAYKSLKQRAWEVGETDL